MTTVTGKHTFEIEVTLTGTVMQPSGDGWNDPHEDGGVEDIEVAGIAGLEMNRAPKGGAPFWLPCDLMTGVDFRNPEVQKLLANIANFMGDDAVQAIVDGAAERTSTTSTTSRSSLPTVP